MAEKTKRKILTLARQGCMEEITKLLDQNNLCWTDCRYPTGDTPLHVAAHDGNLDVMRFLLGNRSESKKFIDVPSTAGKTALHEAAQNAKPNAVSYLLSKGANSRSLKQADWTPLMLACTRTGDQALHCCELLMKAGGREALVDRNKDGWTALHIAVREGDNTIVALLLQADPQQATVRSKNGRTPLHTAALHGHTGVVKQLLKSGLVDFNAQDSCGSSPIHDAVRSGNIDAVKVLVQAGANLNACNSVGHGVMHMAAEAGKHDMLLFLKEQLKQDVDSISITDSSTPLHSAARAGQMESVKSLLRMGANPLARDAWGRSCFQLIPNQNADEIEKLPKEVACLNRVMK